MSQNRATTCLQFSPFLFVCVDLWVATDTSLTAESGVILFTKMQINAAHPWLIQPSQPELTGTKACLICDWFYILRGELFFFFFMPLSPISNLSECPGMNGPKLSNRQGLGKHSRAAPALQQEVNPLPQLSMTAAPLEPKGYFQLSQG